MATFSLIQDTRQHNSRGNDLFKTWRRKCKYFSESVENTVNIKRPDLIPLPTWSGLKDGPCLSWHPLGFGACGEEASNVVTNSPSSGRAKEVMTQIGGGTIGVENNLRG